MGRRRQALHHHSYSFSLSSSSFTSPIFHHLLLFFLLLSFSDQSSSFPLVQEATTSTSTSTSTSTNSLLNMNNPILAAIQQQGGAQQPPFPTLQDDLPILLSSSSAASTIASAAASWIWPLSSSTMDTSIHPLRSIQKMGETMLVAMMVVAFLQAAFAAIQYRTNPDGELIVPPGLTYGVSIPNDPKRLKRNNKQRNKNNESDHQRRFFFWQQKRSGRSIPSVLKNKGTKRSLKDKNRNNYRKEEEAKPEKNNKPSFMKSLQRDDKIIAPQTSSSSASSTTVAAVSSSSTNALKTASSALLTTSSSNNNQQGGWNRKLSQFLVILLPIIRTQVAFYMESSLHIFHLTFAVILANFFDFPNRWFFTSEVHHSTTHTTTTTTTTTNPSNNTTTTTTYVEYDNNKNINNNNKQKNNPQQQQHNRRPTTKSSSSKQHDEDNDEEKHIIVIGDSLAVGLGCYDIFDKMKNNTLPYSKIENLGRGGGGIGDGSDDGGDVTASPKKRKGNKIGFFGGRKKDRDDGEEDGPVFPRVLSETLADSTNKKVTWRSAGVDGGDTQHIMDFLLSVVEEEVIAGRTPDIVVVLCGINDLKRSLVGTSIRQRLLGPRLFRARLRLLVRAIRRTCLDGGSNAKMPTIVLPSMPTQMFHKNSPLNIFPLNLFLDTIIGLWDSQKRLVAEQFTRTDNDDTVDGKVLYLRLGPSEVLDWYRHEHDEQQLQQQQHQQHHQQPNREGSNNKDIGDDDDHAVTLISADGIHPNAKCYELWASSLGKRLSSILL